MSVCVECDEEFIYCWEDESLENSDCSVCVEMRDNQPDKCEPCYYGWNDDYEDDEVWIPVSRPSEA